MEQKADQGHTGSPRYNELIDQPVLREASQSFLRVNVVLLWVGLSTYSLVHFFYSPTYWQRMAVSLVLGLVGVVAWWLLSVNRVQAAEIGRAHV